MPVSRLRAALQRTDYRFSLSLFAAGAAALVALILTVIGLDHPYWSDEQHYHETIVIFSRNALALLDYPEMMPPLYFLVFGALVKLFNLGLPGLRIASLIVAVIAWLVVHRLLFTGVKNAILAAALALFLVVNPYMIGLSFFLYTDMVGFIFVLLACMALSRHQPVRFGLWAALALLTRQYYAFLMPVAAVWAFLHWQRNEKPAAIRLALGTLAACVPLGIMVVLWKGPMPAYGHLVWVTEMGIESGFGLTPAFVVSYILLTPVYLFPFVIMAWRVLFTQRTVLVPAALLTLLYPLAPVTVPLTALLNSPYKSLGFFHRMVRLMVPMEFGQHIVFALLFFVGLCIAVRFAIDCWKRIRERRLDTDLLCELFYFSFLAVMLFSFNVWEKYLLPLLPFVALRLVRLWQEQRLSRQQVAPEAVGSVAQP